MKIFRKIRQSLIGKSKFQNYLLYAIGEIILVMIGILLALQVNNWSEVRKQKAELNNVLKSIAADMIVDTTVATQITAYYKRNLENSQKVINKELTLENYSECLECLNLVTFYNPFNIQTRGFERLKIINQQSTTQNDSLVNDIVTLYSQIKPLIEKNNEFLENEVSDNFNHLKTFDWFVDMIQGNLHNNVINYFVSSEDYRKRVASHTVLISGNHLNLMKTYKESVKQILERIDKRLKDNKK